MVQICHEIEIWFLKMRIILTLILIFFFTNAGSKGKKICEGFCKGEELILVGTAEIYPVKVVVNGKKKKIKFQSLDLGARVKDSYCLPFYRLAILEPKKKDKKAMLGTLYDVINVNTCGPCGPNDGGLSGYCPLTAYLYEKFYDKAYEYGLYPQHYFHSIMSPQKNGLMLETFTLSLHPKKDWFIMRFFNKDENVFIHAGVIATYKTTLKEQLISETKPAEIVDEELITFIENYASRLTNSYSSEKITKKERIKNLYNSLPTNQEIDTLIKNFPELEKYYIQTRN